MTKVNIHHKLANAIEMLQKVKMKKSGRNKFANYDYFELNDFLNPILEINKELDIKTMISFPGDQAILKVIDLEDGEEILFESPMGKANLKGSHDVQNLGACHTYMRRYMYILAYEIGEHDGLEPTTGSDQINTPTSSPTTKISMTPSVSKAFVLHLNTMETQDALSKFFLITQTTHTLSKEFIDATTERKKQLGAS